MKLAIVGSRTFTDYDKLETFVLDNVDVDSVSLIVSGGANGADFLAEEFANRYEIPLKVIPARWNDLNVTDCRIKYNSYGKPYNSLAGFNRNKEVVEAADVILAAWNGTSPGTKHAIQLAEKAGKKVLVLDINK